MAGSAKNDFQLHEDEHQTTTTGGLRIPTEFRYWEQLNTPKNRWLRRLLKLLFGTDPALPDEVVRQYAASYYDADPVAEAFVEEVYMRRGQAYGRALLDRALAEGIDAVTEAPDSMRRLFAQVEEPPPWLDAQRVEQGARVFRRFGTHMYSFAGAITLHGYLENSVAKPLALTGAYTGESANRRFLETARFWIDVSEPGGLWSGGQGRETALRVRIMHVFVRKRLLEHPEWDLDAWGVPISQGDALLTLMGGSFIPGYGLKAIGYRTTRDEIEAMMHFWRYVGYLVGVQPRWYPQSIEEALGLVFASHVKSVQSSGDDGKNLAHSYVNSYDATPDDAPAMRLRKRLEHKLQLGYVRLFLPPPTHAQYALPKAGPWLLHPLLQFPWIFTQETLCRHSKRIAQWHDTRVRNATKRWVQSRLGTRRATYKSVAEFTR